MTPRDSFKAAAYTVLFSFITLFALSLLGWLGDVLAWAQDTNDITVFPDPSVLIKAAVSASVSAIIGLVNFVVRYVQGKVGGGEAPVYAKVRRIKKT